MNRKALALGMLALGALSACVQTTRTEFPGRLEVPPSAQPAFIKELTESGRMLTVSATKDFGYVVHDARVDPPMSVLLTAIQDYTGCKAKPVPSRDRVIQSGIEPKKSYSRAFALDCPASQ